MELKLLFIIVVWITASEGLSKSENATKNEFPWLVWFESTSAESGETFFCTGTLIDLNLVLTSATCAVGVTTPVTVIAGDLVLLENDGTEQEIISQDVIIHESYNVSGTFDNNIALLRLTSNYQKNKGVQAISLPSDIFDPQFSSHGIAAGWGGINSLVEHRKSSIFYEGLSPILIKKEVIVNKREVCSSLGVDFPDGQFCTRATSSTEIYPGDLGGPMICVVDLKESLCGILSHVKEGSSLMGGYLQIPLYLEWIETHRNLPIATTEATSKGSSSPHPTFFTSPITTQSTTPETIRTTPSPKPSDLLLIIKTETSTTIIVFAFFVFALCFILIIINTVLLSKLIAIHNRSRFAGRVSDASSNFEYNNFPKYNERNA